MNMCEHKTLHIEGKNLAYLVCSCGKKWRREVNYTKNTRYTFFRAVEKPVIRKQGSGRLTIKKLKDEYGIEPEEANMI